MTDDRTPAEGTADDADRHATEELGRASTGGTPTGDADQFETVDLGVAAPGAAVQPEQTAHPAQPVHPTQRASSARPAQPVQHAQPTQPVVARPGVGGWAIAALVVGIGAFLVGLVPGVGLLVALVGVALGVVALVLSRRRPGGLGLGITGVALSGVAAATNVAVLAVLLIALPIADRASREAVEALGRLDESDYGTTSVTPDSPADYASSCWSFSLPAGTWASQDGTDTCTTSLDVTDDGAAASTSVDVVTVPAAVASGLVPEASADRVADAVAALSPSWLPAVGTVVGETEQTTLDGQPAALVRLAGGDDLGAPAAVVVAWSPADATGASSLTLVTVRADVDDDLGDDSSDGATAGARAAATERTLTSVTSTWDWAGR